MSVHVARPNLHRHTPPPPERLYVSVDIAASPTEALLAWVDEHLITSQNVVGLFEVGIPKPRAPNEAVEFTLHLRSVDRIYGISAEDMTTRRLVRLVLDAFDHLPQVAVLDKAQVRVNIERHR